MGVRSQGKQMAPGDTGDSWGRVPSPGAILSPSQAERRRTEELLSEATDREQELLRAQRALETRLDEAQRGMAQLTQEQQELSASLQDEQKQKEQLKRAKSELEEQKRLLDRSTEKLNREVGSACASSPHQPSMGCGWRAVVLTGLLHPTTHSPIPWGGLRGRWSSWIPSRWGIPCLTGL